MKKIDLQEKMNSVYAEMETLTNGEDMTEDQVTKYEELKTEYEGLKKKVAILEDKEKYAASVPVTVTVKDEEKDEFTSYAEAFQSFIKSGGKEIPSEYKSAKGGLIVPSFLYADPILKSTNTDVVNKTVANELKVRTPASQQFLQDLGVSIYPNLNGDFVVPSSASITAGFVAEGGDVSTANTTLNDLKLTSRAVGAHQTFGQEWMANTNPAIMARMIQLLVDGVWDAVAADLFTQILSDAATRVGTETASGLSYGDLVNMDASVVGMTENAAYVTTKSIKSYLQQLNSSSAGIKFAWSDDNTIAGVTAKAHSKVSSGDVFYSANWADAAIGQWGGIDLLVDPYTYGNSGKVKVVARALFDTGCALPESFTIYEDVSAGI